MKPGQFTPLTADEHLEMGRAIKLASARLQELERLVVGVYGPGAQAAFSFRNALQSIERLQHDLEAQAAADLPGTYTGGFYR